MNLIKFLALSIFGIIIFQGCNPKNATPTVTGEIRNANGEQITLIGFDNGRPDTLGTQMLAKDGSFSFTVPPARLDFYNLTLDGKGSIILAFDSTQSPVIEADADHIPGDYTVSGSKDSEDLRDFQVKSYAYEVTLDSLMKNLQKATHEHNNEERIRYSNAFNEKREAYRDFLIGEIEKDSTNIANFSILQRLDPKEDYTYFVQIRNGLKDRLTGNFFFDRISERVDQIGAEIQAEAAFEPGNVAPDIVLPNPRGEELALSSLRGNYVLIDFWASWCKPCRMENPNVVKMYRKYQDDNFEIFGVSLDRNRENWVKAIADDGLIWPQVSDLKYWNSAAAKLYHITSIPHTVLIDPEGVIVANKLRGPSLEAKLEEIFGH